MAFASVAVPAMIPRLRRIESQAAAIAGCDNHSAKAAGVSLANHTPVAPAIDSASAGLATVPARSRATSSRSPPRRSHAFVTASSPSSPRFAAAASRALTWTQMTRAARPRAKLTNASSASVAGLSSPQSSKLPSSSKASRLASVGAALACGALACGALAGWALAGWALAGWALAGWADTRSWKKLDQNPIAISSQRQKRSAPRCHGTSRLCWEPCCASREEATMNMMGDRQKRKEMKRVPISRKPIITSREAPQQAPASNCQRATASEQLPASNRQRATASEQPPASNCQRATARRVIAAAASLSAEPCEWRDCRCRLQFAGRSPRFP